jgi:cytochrome bd ubiquinol oxidase subunit II
MSSYLPEIFLGLMGFAMLAYVVLDGFDLGVGILLRRASDQEKDAMISSIGPFWDANETWLVLGVGILLTIFPKAHGMILGSLYMPVFAMLLGLTLRGVAFDFRAKVKLQQKQLWDRLFYAGSLLAAMSQGVMLGLHIVGYVNTVWNWLFALFIGLCLVAGYALLGATWLLMKSEGELQVKAQRWALGALWLTAAGIAAVSIVTPLVSERIFARWFSFPTLALLAVIPMLTLALFVLARYRLQRLGSLQDFDRLAWQPFVYVVGIFVLAFIGLAYSLFPYLVMDKLTIWEAASSTATMQLIFLGACLTLPMTAAYTVFTYRVFWGKTQPLSYL